MTKPATAIDRLVSMSETERVTNTALREAIEELADVREWASALEALADHLEQLDSWRDTWAEAESRGEKADAREEMIGCLADLAEAIADVQALADIDGLVRG